MEPMAGIKDQELAASAAATGEAASASTSSPLPWHLVLLFATACGLSVANVYFAHPLLETIARAFAIEPASIGFVVTVTQIGYALGLIFIVPLGDLIDRRRLIVGQGILSAAATMISDKPSQIVPGKKTGRR